MIGRWLDATGDIVGSQERHNPAAVTCHPRAMRDGCRSFAAASAIRRAVR
jgi:hypothetical protein